MVVLFGLLLLVVIFLVSFVVVVIFMIEEAVHMNNDIGFSAILNNVIFDNLVIAHFKNNLD